MKITRSLILSAILISVLTLFIRHAFQRITNSLRTFNVEESILLGDFGIESQDYSEEVYYSNPTDQNMYNLCAVYYGSRNAIALEHSLQRLERHHASIQRDEQILQFRKWLIETKD
jgi:hypothetical protein